VVEYDYTFTEATTFVPGADTDVGSIAVQPTAAGVVSGRFGIVTGGDLGEEGRLNVRSQGIVRALVGEAVTRGDDLVAVVGTDELMIATGAAGEKILAKALETSVGAATIAVEFDGEYGWGQAAEATALSTIVRTTLTAAGGGASEQFTVAGLTAAHIVALTMSVNTVPVTLVSMDKSTAGRITIVFSADPRAGARVDLIAVL
jgi:hypothetical protein